MTSVQKAAWMKHIYSRSEKAYEVIGVWLA
jgi:hypothetical protein